MWVIGSPFGSQTCGAVALGAVVSLLGCRTIERAAPASPQADAVDIRLSLPPPDARLVGPVESVHGYGCGKFGREGTIEGALRALKAAAALRGANYVHLTGRFPPHDEPMCFDQRFRMTGVAYVVNEGYPPDEPAADAGPVSNPPRPPL